MSALSKSKQWPFAALDPGKEAAAGTKQLQGIIFDVDGTLCKRTRTTLLCHTRVAVYHETVPGQQNPRSTTPQLLYQILITVLAPSLYIVLIFSDQVNPRTTCLVSVPFLLTPIPQGT